MLPPEFGDKFEEFIDILHIEYFYHRRYPKERAREEFEAWLGRAEDYLRRLVERTKA